MTDLRSGMLIVATPTLNDPNFVRSVVFIIDRGEHGAVGVMINRALELNATDHVPSWTNQLAPPSRVFEGGPVERETAIGVAYRPGIERSETWHPVLGGVGLVDVSVDPASFDGLVEARIYSGYSGWAAGQLEMEMAVGSWFGVDATPDDVFDPVPATLRRRVLRRQGGEMARYADYPADPRSN
jgi:putative transcriptional regulator